MPPLREDFKGAGTGEKAAADMSAIGRALNNAMVVMPVNYIGDPATVRVDGGKLVIDFSAVDFSKIT